MKRYSLRKASVLLMAVMIGLAPQYLYAAEKEKSEPTNTNASLFKTLDEQKEALKD